MGSEWSLNGKFSFFQPLFAFEYKEVFPENGWKVYDPTWEYRRQVGIVPCLSSSSLLFRSEALCSNIITGRMERRMILLTNVVQTGLGHCSARCSDWWQQYSFRDSSIHWWRLLRLQTADFTLWWKKLLLWLSHQPLLAVRNRECVLQVQVSRYWVSHLCSRLYQF